MTSNDVSSVVFVSCDEKKQGDNIIEQFLGNLPLLTVENDLNLYPWHINTKYYEADINLCVLSKKELQSQQFSELTEGIVLYFDCNSSNWNDNINSWLPFLNEFNAEIKILLCDKCDENNKNLILEWCLKEKYELVEINGESEDSDFPETVGLARIKQALEAHIWPNLIMKERNEPKKMAHLLSGLNRESDISPLITNDNPELSLFLSDALQQDDSDDLLSFDNLFSQLMSMKQKASTLSGNERKDFAEKVVTAYWNAIGGDSDELSDDSSIGEPPDYKKL